MQRNQRNEAGKLFIGGLSWDTNQDSLLSYFSQYGEVIDCVVMKNQQTGKSRGFGFVTFKDPQCVGTVLSMPAHILDGRQVDAKACNPKGLNRAMGAQNHRGGGRGENDPYRDFKIFMGGLPNVDEDFLKNFFGRYGKVVEVNIMKDPSNKKSRGFGFLTFESEDSIEQVCAEHYININGKKVECKRATPRDGKRDQGQPPPFMPPMGRGPPGPPEMMGGPPPPQDWSQGPGNWNQGPPQPQMEGGPPGPPNNFPPGQGYQPPPNYQQPPQQQPPPQQPPFNQSFQGQPGYQGQPTYQQGNWQAQPVAPPGPPNPQPIASPPAEVPGYGYGQHPPQTAYGQQPPANSYGQYATAPAPQPAQVPAQPPAQAAYSAYGQPPTVAPTPANPAYASPVADPLQPVAQPPPAAGAPTAYSGYGYSTPAPAPAPAVPTGVPDPYTQAATQPPAQPGYGGVPPATVAPPADPAAAQPKPDYSAYGYGAYGYGDTGGAMAAAPQAAPAYPGQGDAQLPGAYQAQPGGGYQRASVPTAQPYHPYRR